MAKKENNTQGRKHLFGSSEKSDFILNMTGDGAQTMCAYYSIISVILIALLAIPAYFTQQVVDYTLVNDDGSETVHYMYENFIFYSSAALMLMGCIGFLIFMIACTKKQVSLKDNKSLVTALAVMVLSCVACFTSTSIYTSVLGYLGRHEGLLTILGYWGLFSVAMAVTAQDKRVKISDFIVGLGLFQALVGISQSIPLTAGLTNNFFEYLFVRSGSVLGMDSIGEVVYDGGYSGISAIYTHSYAASGFTASPYALAALLTVTFACAAAGAALDKSKKRRIFYGISAPIMAAAAFHTLVTPAVIGIACGGIIVLAISIARSISGGGKSAVITAVIICAVAGATGGILFGTDTITLRDEQVIFTDGYVMRSITHNGRDDTSTDIYTYLRDDGLYVAEQNLLTGVGEDTTPYALSTYGLRTDRFYNEYVDMAATRGVPCLVFYGLFLLTALIRMIKNLKSAVKGESFIPAAAAAAVIAYLVQAFFNTSWTTSAPIFYIMLGLAYTSTVHSSQGTVHS